MALDLDQRSFTPHEIAMQVLGRYELPPPGTPQHQQVALGVRSVVDFYRAARVTTYLPNLIENDLRPFIKEWGLKLTVEEQLQHPSTNGRLR